jgi:RNA polymerase sigma-70 factor (ECF subfamily)
MPEEKATISDPSGWVDLHGEALFRFALMRVRNRDVAEELVQETFLAALRAKDAFAGHSTERTWLIGILRRKITDHYRKASATAPLEGTDVARGVSTGDENFDPKSRGAGPRRGKSTFSAHFFDDKAHWKSKVPAWPADPDMTLTRADFWRVLDDCMGKLPATVASAFCLREIEHLETEEICKILDITATNLWARIYRSRMWLRECLERNWFRDPGRSEKRR